jgi:hypothetical protein
MTLDELLKRLSEDRSAKARRPQCCANTDGYVDHKLRTAHISAGIHYCPEKWDRYGTATAAKANLIRDISNAQGGEPDG